MTAAVIVLSILCLIFIILFIAQGRQIRKICRQLAFLKNENTNMKLTFDSPFREINELTEELNGIIEKSRENELRSNRRDDELRKTITDLSHDIRTPLTSLDGYFQLLLQAESDEEKLRYAEIIQTRISSLKDILDELFTYTKLQNAEYELALESVDLSRVVCDSALLFYRELTERGIEPNIDIPDETITVNGNEEALKRVFRNIIKNALEHGKTEESGTAEIIIRLKEANGTAVFSCSNSVDSAQEIDVSRVFERFYKSDSARTHISTGLGLSIAKELAQRMGGTAKAELSGDMFTVAVELPVDEFNNPN